MTDTPPLAKFPHKLKYWQIGLAVALVLLAFSLRVVLIVQRAETDRYFVPSDGFDQMHYVANGLGILDGTFPTEPFYFHPAPSYLFAGIYAILGRSLVQLYLGFALLDALTVGWMIAAAWLLTRRVWAGFIAGLLFAIYPFSIFYGTSLIIAPLAAALLALLLWFTLWQRDRVVWWRTIALGLVAGTILISRKNLAPLILLYPLWLMVIPQTWTKRILHSAVYIVLAFAVTAPFTLHNYNTSGGQFIFVATTGDRELYMANNRDSNAFPRRSPALEAIDAPYYEAIVNDIQAMPLRFVGLLTYKFTSFWNDYEQWSNLNYYEVRKGAPILQWDILQLSWLVIGSTIGLIMLLRRDRVSALLLASIVLWICFSYVLTFTMGRLRYPVVIPLMLMSAVALDQMMRHIMNRDFDWRTIGRVYAVPLVLVVGMLAFSRWAQEPTPKFPLARTYNALPADAIPLDAQFGEITLVGWRPYATNIWQAGASGWAEVFKAVTVELFWRLDAPTDIEYKFYYTYIDESQRYDSVDTSIGAVGFPDRPTQTWQSGQIIAEVVGLRLDDDVPQLRSGQLRVGVWYWNDNGEIENVALPNGDTNILLQTMAVFDVPNAPDPAPLDNAAIFGDVIALTDYEMPARAALGETIGIPMQWQAIAEVYANYQLFVHVLDENGDYVLGADTMPVADLLTQNWMPDYPLNTVISVPMPEDAGTYQVVVGLYNEAGRLPTGTPNDSIILGEIVVE